MSRNPNHVEFSNRSETVLAFSHDRGVLKSNGFGDYFFRGTTDNRFACCAPELERQLIDLGIKAGERIGIRKSLRNRIATWQVRRMDPPTEGTGPTQHESLPHVLKTPATLPERVYAKLDAPDPDWEDITQPAAEAARFQTVAPAPVETAQGRTVTKQGSTPDSLLGRCLCEALDACKIAQDHANKIGLPVVFGPDQIEAMGVSIFIARTRDGSILERMPPARQTSGKVNGAAATPTL